MPLNPATLSSELLDLFDFVAEAEDPPTADELAGRWADAFGAYLQEAMNPAFNSGAIEAGKAALRSTLAATIMDPPPAGLAALTAGLTAFCAATTALVLPFVSIPPPAPLPTPSGSPAPASAAAAALAATIHTWVITGTASVPPAPPAPWT